MFQEARVAPCLWLRQTVALVVVGGVRTQASEASQDSYSSLHVCSFSFHCFCLFSGFWALGICCRNHVLLWKNIFSSLSVKWKQGTKQIVRSVLDNLYLPKFLSWAFVAVSWRIFPVLLKANLDIGMVSLDNTKMNNWSMNIDYLHGSCKTETHGSITFRRVFFRIFRFCTFPAELGQGVLRPDGLVRHFYVSSSLMIISWLNCFDIRFPGVKIQN